MVQWLWRQPHTLKVASSILARCTLFCFGIEQGDAKKSGTPDHDWNDSCCRSCNVEPKEHNERLRTHQADRMEKHETTKRTHEELLNPSICRSERKALIAKRKAKVAVFVLQTSEKKTTSCGTRTRNLRIRSPTPCPLGQGGLQIRLRLLCHTKDNA